MICEVCGEPATGPRFGGNDLYPHLDPDGNPVLAHIACGDRNSLDLVES